MPQLPKVAARELLDGLRSRGFTILVENDSLNVSPRSQLTDNDRAVIRKLKKPIIAWLSPCESHLDSSTWDREPVEDRPGCEKASCRRCGRFIGFNPIRRTSQRSHDIGIGETDRAPP